MREALSRSVSWLAAIAAAGWGALGMRGVQRTTTSTRLGRSLVSRKHRSTNKYAHISNGQRERDRRGLQMWLGQLAQHHTVTKRYFG